MRGDQIKATMAHDAGAYAQCSYCRRYSDNPNSLLREKFPCDCGDVYGWSGSFKAPTETAQWSEAGKPNNSVDSSVLSKEK